MDRRQRQRCIRARPHPDPYFEITAGHQVLLQESRGAATPSGLAFTGRVLCATIGYVTSKDQEQNNIVFSLLDITRADPDPDPES